MYHTGGNSYSEINHLPKHDTLSTKWKSTNKQITAYITFHHKVYSAPKVTYQGCNLTTHMHI